MPSASSAKPSSALVNLTGGGVERDEGCEPLVNASKISNNKVVNPSNTVKIESSIVVIDLTSDSLEEEETAASNIVESVEDDDDPINYNFEFEPYVTGSQKAHNYEYIMKQAPRTIVYQQVAKQQQQEQLIARKRKYDFADNQSFRTTTPIPTATPTPNIRR